MQERNRLTVLLLATCKGFPKTRSLRRYTKHLNCLDRLIATHARTFRLLHETQRAKESVNSWNIVSERYSAVCHDANCKSLLETHWRIRELSRGTSHDSALLFSHSGARSAPPPHPRTSGWFIIRRKFIRDQAVSRTPRERMCVVRARIRRPDNDIPSLVYSVGRVSGRTKGKSAAR